MKFVIIPLFLDQTLMSFGDYHNWSVNFLPVTKKFPIYHQILEPYGYCLCCVNSSE